MVEDICSFSFGILLYNQQNYVVETLESIKYQVITYGQNIKCNLIIIDDCSRDDSVKIVKAWLEGNGSIFNSSEIIINEKNSGVVFSYNKLLTNITDNQFKILAADDIFSSNNVFKFYSDIKNDELKSFMRVDLIDGKISLNNDFLVTHYKHIGKKISNNKCKKLMRMGGFMHTPSTLYTLGCYKEAQCISFNENFTLFEDDPTWYAIFKNLHNSKVKFYDDVIVLYRVHSNSISNGSSYSKKFLDELNKLRQFYINDASCFEKMYLKSKIRNCKFGFSKMIDYYRFKKCKFMSIFSNKYKNLKEMMEKFCNNEANYYDEIQANAKRFLSNIGR